jgi:hypothetical protein
MPVVKAALLLLRLPVRVGRAARAAARLHGRRQLHSLLARRGTAGLLMQVGDRTRLVGILLRRVLLKRDTHRRLHSLLLLLLRGRLREHWVVGRAPRLRTLIGLLGLRGRTQANGLRKAPCLRPLAGGLCGCGGLRLQLGG